jgi:hypothetical protein
MAQGEILRFTQNDNGGVQYDKGSGRDERRDKKHTPYPLFLEGKNGRGRARMKGG